MVFTHDTEVALQAAVTLANSALEPDTLETVAELDAFFTEFEYTGRHDGDAAELAAVRAARSELYRLLTAERDDAGVPRMAFQEAAVDGTVAAARSRLGADWEPLLRRGADLGVLAAVAKALEPPD